jgi:hypothetical protein
VSVASGARVGARGIAASLTAVTVLGIVAVPRIAAGRVGATNMRPWHCHIHKWNPDGYIRCKCGRDALWRDWLAHGDSSTCFGPVLREVSAPLGCGMVRHELFINQAKCLDVGTGNIGLYLDLRLAPTSIEQCLCCGSFNALIITPTH